MIVVDTSAIMAILLDEPGAESCVALLEAENDIVMSAGTVAELLVVADRRGIGLGATRLIEGLGLEIVPITAASARRIAQAYARWGKGVRPAALNLGDCFAYVAAMERQCPLLFVGDDFARTDVRPALME